MEEPQFKTHSARCNTSESFLQVKKMMHGCYGSRRNNDYCHCFGSFGPHDDGSGIYMMDCTEEFAHALEALSQDVIVTHVHG